MLRKLTYFTSLFICFITHLNAQQIAVDNSLSAQQLIETNLAEGCVQISNVTSSVNGSINGFASFGYFEQEASNFPFQNGIVLSTGNVSSAGGVSNTSPLNEGESDWLTDPDLETALGISNTLNATSIEFDFISASSAIQFNYILASEEYFREYPCMYSDGFAFLIKEVGTTSPYQNIAVIPGTSTPVNTNTIHDDIVGFCPAENEQYFEGYNIGDTNFNGRTTVLSATANITPNTQYHIKLVIADQNDRNFDSAVFIEGNSFTDSIDLGADILSCSASAILNAETNNPQAVYSWYEDGVLLSNETTSTLAVNTSASYMVEITVPFSNATCNFNDTIQVTLNTVQAGPEISDFELCDDNSNDGSEVFELTTKDNEMLAGLPNANYTISYHNSLQDAESGSNSVSTITNATNPETVFIRAVDTSSGCVYISTVNLIVNSLPIITEPDNLDVCNNGSGDVYLTDNDTTITNNNAQLSVTYHYTQNDATTGSNAIASPYTPQNTTETLFIRVVNVNSGCTAFTTITLELLESPSVNNGTQQISACELDDDGFESFDLTSVLEAIITDTTNTIITYHITIEDANSGENPIVNPSDFTNTIPNVQTVYVRIQNDSNSCYEIVAIELHTNILETGTNIRDFSTCDEAPDDGAAPFDLVSITDVIANGLPDITITFYETQEDLDNNTNPIDSSVSYTVLTSQTLFIAIENPDCFHYANIELFVNPSVHIINTDTLTFCDTDNDALTAIDLDSFNGILSEGIAMPSVRYFNSETDAETDVNALPSIFNNTQNPTQLFVRVTNDTTGCYAIQPVTINVLPAPATNAISDIIICDDDQDGLSTVNLENLNTSISTDDDIEISYFPTINDANSSENEITNTLNYQAQTTTIYAKVSYTATGCFALVPITFIVNTLPEFIPITNFRQCESDGNQIADFLFSEKDNEILNGQQGKEVLYFETENNAINNVNPIDKTVLYNNTSQTQTIYVRVENTTDTSCFGVSSFTIEVGSIPVYNAPINVFLCDDISNDAVAEFSLTDIAAQIALNSPETLDITFHLTQANAENQENALPENITNTVNPQELFVSIDNSTYCKGIASFTLNVVQSPEINPAPDMQVCDTNSDGSVSFDLTVAEVEVLQIRQDNSVITYYENATDLENNANPITDPTNYSNTSNPQTVYIEVTNTVSNCAVSVPIALIVNLPPTIATLPLIEECENTDNTFDLNAMIPELIGNQENVAVSFYTSQEDADLETNPLSTFYIYPTNYETIYVRAEFIATQCVSFNNFSFRVNPLPIASFVPDLEACDDDYDALLIFDLSQQTPLVLGSLNTNDYTVSYFETEDNAESNTNAISSTLYPASHNQSIYIRLENNSTHCFTTTRFTTIIHPKPIVDITDQVICLDNLPLTVTAETGYSTDTYLWSTGEITPNIIIENIGSYWVTVTTDFGCITTAPFNVLESESAEITFTETIDFSNPNNITVSISGIGNYLYQLDEQNPQEANVFTNVALGPHTITVIDLYGCNSTTKDVVIIDAPQFVTPNGDGYFDTWHITGVSQLPGTVVTIFNRYGKLLKILKHNSRGWDGNYNGNAMPATDYWYLAKVVKGAISFEVKGHFALRR
ncbi:T9SS type B sorting domain-containing protein [Bizionia saleffrena]|uniref:T9SS type B sorting domain-containing protein n=1 Tax=Bizionia saleffrena TaxID=291189 RepID=A0A8H2QFQ4_9FLAO|nr:choice-of-anchor L domain-containing protein [Bizionia saleffrena]TYB80267.1 T9SS type B sorting domain-containing protein [Bizionia saleffrena]